MMFTTEELNFIEYVTKRVKNQGEMAVPRWLHDNINEKTFTEQQWHIIQYCAEECKRQRSGEMSVYWLLNAWEYAYHHYDIRIPRSTMDFNTPTISLEFISEIGKMAEPHKNPKGFREIPIGIQTRTVREFGPVWGWIEKAKPDTVVPKLERLIEAYYEGNLWPRDYGTHPLSESPEDEFYYEYEEIHPFVDGNGRTGKIIYNYLKGTLDNPVLPPNFWGSENL